MAVTQDMFWAEYTEFDNKNVSFDGDEFIWKSKDIRYDEIHSWYQKYLLPCTKVFVFVACRVTSKVLSICAAANSWCDVKIIRSGKISSISSDVPEKQSIVYISACIKSDRIEQYHYEKQLNDNFSSHTWNEDGDIFYQQLE